MTTRRIAVGSGSHEGTNSAYVLPERRVVIDPGPPGESRWRDLTAGVEAAGLAVTGVEHVLVTHWHVDHAGLAPKLAERAGATLHMHEADAPLVGDYAAARERRVARDARALARWGVPESRVEAITGGDAPSPMPDSVPVDALAGGDEVAGVEVRHAPGHTLGHAAFVAGHELFVGDALLPTYTPNVGGGDTRMDDPLRRYRDALDDLGRLAERLAAAHDDVVARPGHGTTLDLAGEIVAVRAHHEERSDRVAAAVREADGPATPWDVARRLFGGMDGVHAKMGAGEAFAHLRRLADDGRVVRVGDGPLRYRVADG